MADFLFWILIGYGLRYTWELVTEKIEIQQGRLYPGSSPGLAFTRIPGKIENMEETSMEEFKVQYSYKSGHGVFTMTVKAENKNDAKRIAQEKLDTRIFKLIQSPQRMPAGSLPAAVL